MRNAIRFLKQCSLLPLPVKLWMGFLMLLNGIGALFFINHLEAQIALASMLTSMMLMMLLADRYGLTRILGLGLGHLPWLPLVIWLVFRLDTIASQAYFKEWIMTLMIANSISILFDTVDVFRFWSGDRSEIVSLPVKPLSYE